ncbi:MAG: FAD-dependent oxidoreductase [Desulfurococcales archaeon]|nr:FAD-dependent oxidoreductase [Desulfurococcales archaeon]
MRFAFLCKEKPSSSRGKVAVIGAGPAGLAATGYLVCQGYDVDIYDKQPLPGGLMIFAIPPWRIPRERVLEGIKVLKENFGVKFLLRTKVFAGKPRHDEGDDFVEKNIPLEEIVNNYDAVIITTGAWRSRVPRLPGADADGVLTALEYVYKHRIYELGFSDKKPVTEGKVVVIGGGYSAVDAAEQAIRDRADEVHLVYRRTIKYAPAGVYEMERIRAMGVEIKELISPLEIITEDNKVKGIKCQRMKLGKPDRSGRPRPEPIPGSEFIMDADLVIFATGELSTPPVSLEDKEALQKLGIELDKWGCVVVDERYQSSNPKIFVAGDVVTGPSKIGSAVASGLRAACNLDMFLRARSNKFIQSV